MSCSILGSSTEYSIGCEITLNVESDCFKAIEEKHLSYTSKFYHDFLESNNLLNIESMFEKQLLRCRSRTFHLSFANELNTNISVNDLPSFPWEASIATAVGFGNIGRMLYFGLEGLTHGQECERVCGLVKLVDRIVDKYADEFGYFKVPQLLSNAVPMDTVRNLSEQELCLYNGISAIHQSILLHIENVVSYSNRSEIIPLFLTNRQKMMNHFWKMYFCSFDKILSPDESTLALINGKSGPLVYDILLTVACYEDTKELTLPQLERISNLFDDFFLWATVVDDIADIIIDTSLKTWNYLSASLHMNGLLNIPLLAKEKGLHSIYEAIKECEFVHDLLEEAYTLHQKVKNQLGNYFTEQCLVELTRVMVGQMKHVGH